MEHRCTHRYSCDLKVLIHQHNQPVAIGRIRNGSHMGIFVETDFATVGCEQQLKIEILQGRHTIKLPLLEINALVIYKAENGFGAAIDIATPELSALFSDLLRGTYTATYAEPQEMDSFPIAVNG